MQKERIRIVLGLLALSVASVASAVQPRQPNILVLVADDLGYGELGVQGNKDIPTPNIDGLASGGIRFTSGYVSGPYCSPTRAGLQTGRYQQRFGHEFNNGPGTSTNVFGLSLSEKTIGDRLKAAGYATGWFGKSHLGYAPEFHPLRRGYDEFFGFLGGAHSYLNPVGAGGDPILRGTNIAGRVDYLTDAIGDEAVSFIERHKGVPWFTYVPFNAVHSPLEAPEKYLSRFAGIADPKRRAFAGLLSALDDNVGKVLAKVRELGLEEDTLVFFFSDNGGPTSSTTSGNGPLRGFKAQTWEGGIRVPWIVRWTGHLPSGRVDDRPVIQLDVLPTALAAAGVEVKPEWKLDGVNLLPFLTEGNRGTPHEILYWRFGQQLALRKGDWKLVKAVGASQRDELRQWTSGTASIEGSELYNLRNDIGETNNLAASEPDKLKELAADWKAWNAQLVEPAWRPNQGARKARTKQTSTASPAGPWTSGDVLTSADAPQVAGHALAITAEVATDSANGVIFAQGGSQHGYALYLKNRHLVFAARLTGELNAVTADRPLPAGEAKIEVRVTADGAVTLSANGEKLGEGKLTSLVQTQPGDGLTVGEDGGSPVGDYETRNPLTGTVRNLRIALP